MSLLCINSTCFQESKQTGIGSHYSRYLYPICHTKSMYDLSVMYHAKSHAQSLSVFKWHTTPNSIPHPIPYYTQFHTTPNLCIAYYILSPVANHVTSDTCKNVHETTYVTLSRVTNSVVVTWPLHWSYCNMTPGYSPADTLCLQPSIMSFVVDPCVEFYNCCLC